MLIQTSLQFLSIPATERLTGRLTEPVTERPTQSFTVCALMPKDSAETRQIHSLESRLSSLERLPVCSAKIGLDTRIPAQLDRWPANGEASLARLTQGPLCLSLRTRPIACRDSSALQTPLTHDTRDRERDPRALPEPALRHSRTFLSFV